MRCNNARRLLNRYVDKELSGEKIIGLLEEHLQVCNRCKKELNGLVIIKGIISGKQILEAGPDFLVSIKEKLKAEQQAIKIKWVIETGILAGRLVPVMATATMLVIVLLLGRTNMEDADRDKIYFDLSYEEISLAGYIF